MRLLIITGPAGAGKTIALHTLEDAGCCTVDNLPPRLLPALVHHCECSSIERCAVVIDARSKEHLLELPAEIERLRAEGVETDLLFLESEENTLVARFKESRRPHPLFSVQEAPSVLSAVRAERTLIQPLREQANFLIDTTLLTPARLRERIIESWAPEAAAGMRIIILSFGFKYGLPEEADLIFDVRFLNNPHYVPELKRKDGRSKEVAEFVHNDARTAPFQEKMYDLIDFSLPQYIQEGKAYLHIAIGCTGGRHRSVALAEDMATRLKTEGHRVSVYHRDLEAHPAQSSDLEERLQ